MIGTRLGALTSRAQLLIASRVSIIAFDLTKSSHTIVPYQLAQLGVDMTSRTSIAVGTFSFCLRH